MKSILFYLLIMAGMQQQPKVASGEMIVSGIVTDAKTREVLPFVSVSIKKANVTVLTDFDGRYSITVKKRQKLIFSYLCYQTVTVKVKSKTDLNVAMLTNCYELSQ